MRYFILLINLLLLSTCVIWRNTGEDNHFKTEKLVVQLAHKMTFNSRKAPESSGIVWIDGRIYTHGDSFSPSALYSLKGEENGKIQEIEKIPVRGAIQFDWEDLAISYEGGRTLFLGDIGDNLRFRTQKTIYILKEPQKDGVEVQRRLRFRCLKEGKTVYADSEALFYFKGSLYVITKNYGEALLFRIPLNMGNIVNALYEQTISLPSRVTSADISPSQKQLAILSLDYLLLFDISRGLENLDDKIVDIYSTKGCRQCEAVTYKNDKEIIISNEQGDLYFLPLT